MVTTQINPEINTEIISLLLSQAPIVLTYEHLQHWFVNHSCTDVEAPKSQYEMRRIFNHYLLSNREIRSKYFFSIYEDKVVVIPLKTRISPSKLASMDNSEVYSEVTKLLDIFLATKSELLAVFAKEYTRGDISIESCEDGPFVVTFAPVKNNGVIEALMEYTNSDFLDEYERYYYFKSRVHEFNRQLLLITTKLKSNVIFRLVVPKRRYGYQLKVYIYKDHKEAMASLEN